MTNSSYEEENVTRFEAVPATPTSADVEAGPRRRSRSRLFVAVVAVCGVVCIAVGAIYLLTKRDKPDTKSIVSNIQQASALKVQLKALRPSMQINGKTEATVYVVPRQGVSSLEFDAILKQDGPEVTETYVLLNNRAYWSVSAEGTQIRAGCLQPSQVPPVQLVQATLEESSIVKDVQVGDVVVPMNCEGGQLLKLVFAGETFVFCNTGGNQLSHAKGDDLDIKVEYLSDPTEVPDIVAPADLDCPVINTSSLEFTPAVQPRGFWEEVFAEPESAQLARSSCGCNLGKKKPCLFVHGVGTEKNGPIVDSLSSTWGSIQNNAPCCSSTKFVQFDTVSRGWDDASIQDDFCRAALQIGANNQGNNIGDLILVTHSMGNLIASGAVTNGRCGFSSNVNWISLAGPMQGSKTSNLLEQKCSSGGWGDAPVKGILNLVGYCPATRAYLHLKHQSTVDAQLRNSFLAAQSTRQRLNPKTLCGNSAVGLFTTDSALKIVSSMSGHDTENDGVVDMNSCSVGLGGFGTSYTNARYKAAVNHLDASFRNGDGWWGDDRKPVKWFECAL